MFSVLKKSTLLWVGGCCVALFGFTSAAQAWDVEFTRDKDGNRSSSNFNLVVVMKQQTASESLATEGRCNINWNESSCTIEDFPSTTNALVTVYHRTSPYGMQDSVIGKISFWVSVFNHSEIHIPTGVVSFKTDLAWGALNAKTGGTLDVAILPQANIEMGDTLSNRPNSGTTFYGISLGNCGNKDLAADQVDPAVCEMDFLAGCYSPVFSYPKGAASVAKAFVNRTDFGPSDHVMCVNDGQVLDYLIKVQ